MKDLVEITLRYVGYPSVRYDNEKKGIIGNTSDTGFDCSGFVQFVLLGAGFELPRSYTTNDLIRHTEEFFDFFGVFIHEEFRKSGDLVFFSRDGIRPTHIGIYLEKDKIIHAPGLDDTKVQIVDLEKLCKEIRYDKTKNFEQIYSRNPIGFKRPSLMLNRLKYKNRYQELI